MRYVVSSHAASRAGYARVFVLSAICASLALASVSCVTYQSSLREREAYGYNNFPQNQPYYAPQQQFGGQFNDGQGQGFGQQGQGFGQGQFAPPVTMQTFYDELAPYGEWIDTREHGFIWRPFGIHAGWRPYLHNGRWVSTQFGWTWVSDYVWGWAPFHYGRWRLDPFLGWVWHPGRVWGPAWVEWRFWNGHYCWAPLMPGVAIGAGFRGGSYHWSMWNVVPGRFFTQRALWNHCLPHSRVANVINNTTIINNTTVINNNTYFTGPAVSDVERYSGKVTPLALKNLNKVAASSVDDATVSFYRPDVSDNAGKAQNAAFRPASATPANQASTGKAGVLLNQTPENADRIAPPSENPTPNATRQTNPALEQLQRREANDPLTTPPPAGKATPSGLGDESGRGGKVTPMPTPVGEPQRSAPLPERSAPEPTSFPSQQPAGNPIGNPVGNPTGNPTGNPASNPKNNPMKPAETPKTTPAPTQPAPSKTNPYSKPSGGNFSEQDNAALEREQAERERQAQVRQEQERQAAERQKQEREAQDKRRVEFERNQQAERERQAQVRQEQERQAAERQKQEREAQDKRRVEFERNQQAERERQAQVRQEQERQAAQERQRQESARQEQYQKRQAERAQPATQPVIQKSAPAAPQQQQKESNPYQKKKGDG